MIVAERHRRWSQIFESHGRIVASEIGLEDGVLIRHGDSFRYIIGYGNVQLFGAVGREAGLFRIATDLAASGKGESHLAGDPVIGYDRQACNAVFRQQVRQFATTLAPGSAQPVQHPTPALMCRPSEREIWPGIGADASNEISKVHKRSVPVVTGTAWRKPHNRSRHTRALGSTPEMAVSRAPQCCGTLKTEEGIESFLK